MAGAVEISAPYGQDPETRQWLSPTRRLLGLGPRQIMTPELDKRLCYTATQCLSYEAAANTAAQWGAPLAASTIFKHVQRKGVKLHQARAVYVVADGEAWIWNLVEDRFGEAMPLLDFYHASQHLWAVAHALHPDHEAARDWVQPILHQLKHGEETRVLQGLKALLDLLDTREEEQRKIVANGQAYFEQRKQLLHYAKAASQGCPIGSGAIESTCSQLQDRFKRTGQFWIRQGHSNLMALDLARRNNQWREIWKTKTAA